MILNNTLSENLDKKILSKTTLKVWLGAVMKTDSLYDLQNFTFKD